MNERTGTDNDKVKVRRFSLRSLFMAAALSFGVFFMMVTVYSYYDMTLIRSSSSSLVKNSIPRIMRAQRALVNLERLRGFINTIESGSDPMAARNAYIDASALLTESMFDVEDVAVLSQSVLNKVKLMWNTRSSLSRVRSELMRNWMNLALIINRISIDSDRSVILKQDDFLGFDYLPAADFGGFMLSDHVRKQYEKAFEICSGLSQDSDWQYCEELVPAREEFDRNYSYYNSYTSELKRRSEEVSFLINLMASSYTKNETAVISTELSYITNISKDLASYLLLISAFVLISCSAFYVAVFLGVIRPLQDISIFINRFNRKLNVEDLHLPNTRITELYEMVELLRHLFEDVKKITTDSERITQRYSELLTISYYDELTGAHNRRALELFNRTMGEVPARCAVMMVDIDFFKKFNDTLGHQKGDMVLRRVSVCLIKNTSESDIVYRYGGEEFCIVLQNVDRDILTSIGRRLCQAVKQLDIINPGNDNRPVTISIGISPATLEKGQWSLEELISKADAALYEAKRSGRERFVFYEEEQDKLL